MVAYLDAVNSLARNLSILSHVTSHESLETKNAWRILLVDHKFYKATHTTACHWCPHKTTVAHMLILAPKQESRWDSWPYTVLEPSSIHMSFPMRSSSRSVLFKHTAFLQEVSPNDFWKFPPRHSYSWSLSRLFRGSISKTGWVPHQVSAFPRHQMVLYSIFEARPFLFLSRSVEELCWEGLLAQRPFG